MDNVRLIEELVGVTQFGPVFFGLPIIFFSCISALSTKERGLCGATEPYFSLALWSLAAEIQ